MLSLERCYKIDPELKKLPKEEVLEIRNYLYELGELAMDDFFKKKDVSKNPDGSLLEKILNNKM